MISRFIYNYKIDIFTFSIKIVKPPIVDWSNEILIIFFSFKFNIK